MVRCLMIPTGSTTTSVFIIAFIAGPSLDIDSIHELEPQKSTGLQ